MEKNNPILDAIYKSYIKHGLDTEKAVYAMLMSKAVKDKLTSSLSELKIEDIARAVHEQTFKNMCVNFAEGELILQNNYEVHSVSASRDDDGDPEVSIHMYEMETGEVHSVRVYQFPQIDWLLQIIEVVNNKCELTFNNDEDE